MIDRRFLLQVLAAATAGGMTEALRAAVAADPAAAELLFDELSRLQAQAYSEESTPMFLACENLAAGGEGPPAGFEPTGLNERLAAAYRDYAALLPGLDREETEYDAAMLVELLAERDFQAGGQ